MKILPLEYTLVSKQSAIEQNYDERLQKDVADIEYIIQHKDELGISDEMVEKIKEKYPDYSVSIAYKIENGEANTMTGESYKEYILMNRGNRTLS